MEQPALPIPPRRRIPRWAWIVASIVIALALLVLIPRLILRHKINAELAAMRAEGYPTTLAELDDWYQYPAGENAADVLTTAFGNYSDTNRMNVPVTPSERLPSVDRLLPENMKSRIAAYLADNAKAIELLHKSAAIPGCRFPVTLRFGMAGRLDHLSRLWQGAHLLELEAVMAADKGESDEAADALAASLGLGRSLRNEPLMSSQSVRSMIHWRSCEVEERVLSQVPLSDARLRQLAALVADEEDPAALERSLAGETCSMNATLEQMGVRNGFLQTIFRASGLFQVERLRYLQSSRRTLALAKLPLAEAIKGAQAMEDEFERTARRGIPLVPNLSAMLVLPWEGMFVRQARDLAPLRTMRAAFAVERFRLAKGYLPESLAELVPEFLAKVPADPFDDKPLRYRKEEKGYVIYSIGPNLKDEGGEVPTTERRGVQPDDIPFRVVR